MPHLGSLPFPQESIQQMQRDVVDLSGVLGFLLQLRYGDPLTVTVNGVTTKVVYDPENTKTYDTVYSSLADQYTASMRSFVYDMFNLINQEAKAAEKLG